MRKKKQAASHALHEGDVEECPACGSMRAVRTCTNPTPTKRSHPAVPAGMIPVGSYDVQCWECGERSTIIDYAYPSAVQ